MMRRTCRHLDLFIHVSYLFLVVLSSIEHCAQRASQRDERHNSSIVRSASLHNGHCALNDRHVWQEALRRDNDACFYATTMLLLLLLLLCAINPNGEGRMCILSIIDNPHVLFDTFCQYAQQRDCLDLLSYIRHAQERYHHNEPARTTEDRRESVFVRAAKTRGYEKLI